MLRFENVSKNYGSVSAVKDVTLSVSKGEIFILMGLSGSGKSTLLRCANALIKPSQGHVWLDTEHGSHDLTRVDARTLQALRQTQISMVFQKFALLPWRSLRDNVAFGLELRNVSKQERLRIADEKLEIVGLGSWKDKRPEELSGGMQQRVGLARALATDAPLLLLDEPFSALDPLTRVRLQDELLALQRDLKKTMVFVTHDLDEALRLGSRIAVMEAGRVVQVGSPEILVTQSATSYVRQFVAHVNPLNVLSGLSMMRQVSQLTRDPNNGSTVFLDTQGHYRCVLDEHGRLQEIIVGEKRAALVPFSDDLNWDTVTPATLVSGSPKTSLRTAIRVHQSTGHPMPVTSEEGHLLGVVGNREVYRAMLGGN